MTSGKIALFTQVLSIASSADGKRLKVTRIARGKHTAEVELDAKTLEPAPAGAASRAKPTHSAKAEAKKAGAAKAATEWLPTSSLEVGLKTAKRAWKVGEFGAGLWVHTLSGERVVAPLPFNDPALTVTAFAISADERHALVGNASGFVSVFDTATGDECFGQRLHRGHVTAACIAPDGRLAYTGSASGELCTLTIPRG